MIWVVVAGLNVATILAFAESTERKKALTPMVFGLLVPALAYAAGWLWERWHRSRGGE